jgi:beta-barrel assembly-enhancing protease
LPAVLQTLEAINPQESGLALMTKTHPTPTARLQKLDVLMSKNLDQYATQPQVADRFVQIVGKYVRK